MHTTDSSERIGLLQNTQLVMQLKLIYCFDISMRKGWLSIYEGNIYARYLRYYNILYLYLFIINLPFLVYKVSYIETNRSHRELGYCILHTFRHIPYNAVYYASTDLSISVKPTPNCPPPISHDIGSIFTYSYTHGYV